VADAIEISWPALLQACETPHAKKLLRKTPFPLDDLLALVPPAGAGEPYGRHPIYRGAEGEVLLVRSPTIMAARGRSFAFCAGHFGSGTIPSTVDRWSRRPIESWRRRP